MSDTFRSALIRGVIGATIFAGSAFFAQLSTGGSLKSSGVAAGVAFFGYLILRSGIEGYIDAQAASNGGRRASDSTSPATAPPPPAR